MSSSSYLIAATKKLYLLLLALAPCRISTASVSRTLQMTIVTTKRALARSVSKDNWPSISQEPSSQQGNPALEFSIFSVVMLVGKSLQQMAWLVFLVEALVRQKLEGSVTYVVGAVSSPDLQQIDNVVKESPVKFVK